MKNGLYHNQPADYAIYVVESMVPVIGHTSITGHVENARHEGSNLIADVAFEGQTYTVKHEQFGAEGFWTIVQGPAKECEMTQVVRPEPEIGDKVRIHGVGFGSGEAGEVVSQVYQEEYSIATRYCQVDLAKYGSIAFPVQDLEIIPLVQCPRCQCLVHADELKVRGCPICSYPELSTDDNELSPEDITAIEEAMAQPTLGPYTFEELVQVIEQARDIHQKVQDTLTAFFAAVGEYVNKHVLASDDMIVRPICGHPYITKLTPGMSVEDIAFLKSGFCPECAAREAEFEIVAEAEYQCYHAGLAGFFQVVALLASQEVDPFCLDWETAIEWHELQDAWEVQTC